MKNFSMILACDSENGIGKNNDLAWKLKKDMKYFAKTTISTESNTGVNAVIMGRKTWESIPEKFRPLPGRLNVVLSRDRSFQVEGAEIFHDFESALQELSNTSGIEAVFVIGGGYLYNSLLDHAQLQSVYITHIERDFHCDVFFDGLTDQFQLKTMSSQQQEGDIEFYYARYEKKET